MLQQLSTRSSSWAQRLLKRTKITSLKCCDRLLMDINLGEGVVFFILQDSFHVLQHEMTRFGKGKWLSITLDAPVLAEISH
jgi:hypothetical protein